MIEAMAALDAPINCPMCETESVAHHGDVCLKCLAKNPKAGAEHLLGQLRELTTSRDAKQSAMQQKIDSIKLVDEKPIQDLNAVIAERQTAFEAFVIEHRKKIFTDDKKSIEALYGEFGFKETPGAVAFLKGWDKTKVFAALAKAKIIAAIEKLVPKYIRLKLELDVATMNKDFRANKLTDDKAKKFGCWFDKEDKFFFNLKPVQSATQA